MSREEIESYGDINQISQNLNNQNQTIESAGNVNATVDGDGSDLKRSGSKEFTPAVDQTDMLEAENRLKKRRAKSETKALIKEVAAECAKIIEENNPDGLISYLDTVPEKVKIDAIVDEEGYTLLHMCASNNRTNVFRAVLKKAKEKMYQYNIAEWVNQKTIKDEFTALHYASFKGNIHILKLLMANGADMYTRNLFGLNVLHIAA